MPSNKLNVYPDSDFWTDSSMEHLSNAIDLSKLRVYRVNGVEMIQLCDLETLGISVKRAGVEELKVSEVA